MSSKRFQCAVVEIPLGSDGEPRLDLPPSDLLPWADPYIAKLLTKHRLQAALDDSLQFVEDEAAAGPRVAGDAGHGHGVAGHGHGVAGHGVGGYAAGQGDATWERFQAGAPPNSASGWQSYFD